MFRNCYEMDAFFFFFPFLPFPFLYIYTYKDHSLCIVVRRPYGGLTFRFLFFLPISTSVDCLVATAEQCLVSFRTGSGLTLCPSIFSYCTASSIFSILWTAPLHASRQGSSTYSTWAVLRLCGYL